MQRGCELTRTGRSAQTEGGRSALVRILGTPDAGLLMNETLGTGWSMDGEAAERRSPQAGDARALRLDIGIFLLGGVAMVAASLVSGAHMAWLVPALLGWSVAVGIHALAVLTGGPVLERAWQEGMALERIRRYESQNAQRDEATVIARCEADLAGGSEVQIESELATV